LTPTFLNIPKVLRRPLSRGFSSIPYPAHILTSPATDVSKTSNGVRVASEVVINISRLLDTNKISVHQSTISNNFFSVLKTAHGETATIEVWIDAGSRNETEKNNGASNFLTKLAFNGTTNMPHSQQVKEMASIGNRISAYTTREHTVYTAKVSKDHVANAMALLADMIQNPILDDSLLLDTRAESLCELDMMHQDHAQSVWEHLHETAFMGTGLSQTKYGVQHTIATLNAADIGAFKSSQYSADRFVIAAAGAVDHANLLALTEKHFGQVPALPSGSLVIPYDAAIFTGSDKRIRFDSMGVSFITIVITMGITRRVA
jgi:predicted Zn-dependent peptidase